MEETIGKLREVSGFTYDILYDLIFTSERVVVILIQSPSNAIQYSSFMSMLIGDWYSNRKIQEDRIKFSEELQRQSKTLSLDELLRLNPGNFEIRYSDLSFIKMKHSLLDNRLTFQWADPTVRKPRSVFTLNKVHLTELKAIFPKIPRHLIRQD